MESYLIYYTPLRLIGRSQSPSKGSLVHSMGRKSILHEDQNLVFESPSHSPALGESHSLPIQERSRIKALGNWSPFSLESSRGRSCACSLRVMTSSIPSSVSTWIA